MQLFIKYNLMDYSLLLAIEQVAPLTHLEGKTPGEKSSLGSNNEFYDDRNRFDY